MIPVTTLRPFTRMLMTIGQIPTSYLISMTYEEQLLWLCNFLEKEVIPALNNNAEAVKEVQELYTELKSYVDNYFDNLDVQEEINNKLDEMAEQGQLADIIAQYLGLAGVLAFDTISDMASATNITEGSICRTLGETNYLDGKGAFYKVRTITSGDVVDGVNIVALNVSNTLIAERIPDNSDLLNLITKTPEMLFGVSFKASGMSAPDEMDFIVSLDGINFSNIKIPNFALRDPSIVYDKKRKKFYLTGTPETQTDYTFVIYESSDLITWTSHYIVINNYLTKLKWSPDLFMDETNDKLIVTFSYEYGTETDINNNTIPAFDIIITETTDFENFTMTNTRVIDLSASDHRSHIDSNIIYKDNKYYLVVNKQYSKILEIFESSDLTTFDLICSNVLNSHDVNDNTIYLEGASQYVFNNEYHIISDSYANLHTLINSKSDSFENFEHATTNLSRFRHPSIITINDDEAKRIISKLPNYNLKTTSKLSNSPKERNAYYIQANQSHELTAIPNTIFYIVGNATITNLRNSFNCDSQEFVFITNTNVTVNINAFDDITKNVPLINTTYNNEKSIEVSLNKNSNIFAKNTFEELTVYPKQEVINRITNLNPNIQITDAVAYRAGNVLQVFLDIKLINAISSYVTLFQFNTVDFQPRAKIQMSSSAMANIAMFNNGACSGNINYGANTNISITGTYIAK